MIPIIPPDLSDLEAVRLYFTQVEDYLRTLEDRIKMLENGK